MLKNQSMGHSGTMSDEQILVVEDEEDILELIRYNLTRAGYRVDAALTGTEALRRCKSRMPSLVLLDLMLPELDGLEVCRRLKEQPHTAPIPIIMVTARGEEKDIVRGLELGAEDYITKPFSPRVLVARVQAVLRRLHHAAPGKDAPVTTGAITIHPGRREVLVDGEPVDLTYSEFQLLHHLARRPGWVHTRNQIIDAIHGPDYVVVDRTVDVLVVGLRKKLGEQGRCIQTVRGVGYKFQEQAS